MSGAQETVLTLARELSGAGEAEEALLELLCQAAEQQWEKRLRPGMTAEDCGKAFPCAVAFTAAADLAAARGGEGVSGFTAGSVSVRIRGADHAAQHLPPVKTLAAAVLLHHHHRQALHRLIGGKSLAAGKALPPAADAAVFVRGPGINDLALTVTAIGTLHTGPPNAPPAPGRQVFPCLRPGGEPLRHGRLGVIISYPREMWNTSFGIF